MACVSMFLMSFMLRFNNLKMGQWMEIKWFHRGSLAYKTKTKVSLRQCSLTQIVIAFPPLNQWMMRTAITKTLCSWHSQISFLTGKMLLRTSLGSILDLCFATANEWKHEVQLEALHVQGLNLCQNFFWVIYILWQRSYN